MVVRSSSPPTLHASSPYCPAAPRREASLRFDQISKPSMTGPHTSASSTLLGSSMETEMYPLTHNHAFGNMPHMPHHVESSRNPAFDGPNRFGPVCRSGSVQEDLLKCHVSSMGNFTRLQQTCQNNGIHRHFTQEQIFQVAAYKNFSVGKAFRLLKKMDPRYMNTTIQQIESQLNTHTLFPLPPDLRAPAVDAFFYMRPARYHPLETPTSTIIANLIYVMNSIYQRHRDYENHKIGFIANMNDWTMEHFSVDYCFQFMQGLQGRLAPVNVDMFLIVNRKLWSIAMETRTIAKLNFPMECCLTLLFSFLSSTRMVWPCLENHEAHVKPCVSQKSVHDFGRKVVKVSFTGFRSSSTQRIQMWSSRRPLYGP